MTTTTTTQKGHHPLVDVFFDDDGESSKRRPISFVSSLKKVDLTTGIIHINVADIGHVTYLEKGVKDIMLAKSLPRVPPCLGQF